jgi:pimeloyl-ACP methyl ester carboxylesterase
LLDSEWDFTDNIVVGHSSGAVEVLNLLMDERCPRIKLGVMVSAWPGGIPNGYDDGSVFADLFPPEGFNCDLITSKADSLAFLHGSDDPYCPLELTKPLAEKLGVPLTVIPNGKHLGSNYSELPELWHVIEPSL